MTKNDCYKQTEDLFLQKQVQNERIQNERIQKTELKIPELKQLNKELADICASFFTRISESDLSQQDFEELKNASLDLQTRRAELLFKNGLSYDYLDKPYTCKLCKDTGIVDGQPCKCFKKALAEQYLKCSNLQTIYKNKTFRTFDTSYYQDSEYMQKVLEYCKKYVSKFGKQHAHMLFSGVPGCGKTHLSAAVGTALIANGYFVFYTPVQQMISAFEAQTFRNDKQADTSVYTDCDLLIIDDLGAEMQTSFSESVLYNIINDRLNLKKPMIISTNLQINEFPDIYHERLCSRLIYEFAKFPFPKTDVRREKEIRLRESSK